MKYLLLVCLMLQFYSLRAQRNIDSLQQLLLSQKNDTGKVNTLYELTTQLITNDLKQALVYANQGLRLSEQLGYKKGKAGGLGSIGNVFLIEGDYNKAIENHLAALDIRMEINDKLGITKSYSNIARAYSYMDNYPLSMKYHLLALKQAEEIRNIPLVFNTLVFIGQNYSFQEDYLNAIRYYEQALAAAGRTTEPLDLELAYGSLSEAYLKQGQFNRAFDIVNLFFNKHVEDNDSTLISWDYYSFARIYESWGDSVRQAGDTKGAQKNYSSALVNFLDADRMNTMSADSSTFELGGLSDFYADLGSFYIKLGDFQKAEKYLNNSLAISKKLDWYDNLKNSYKGLYRLDSTKKDFQNAFKNYQFFIYYKEKLTNKNDLAKAESSRMQYEFDKKEAVSKAEQEKKDAEAKKTRNLQYSAIGFFLLLAVFLTWNNRQQQKAKKKIGKAFTELKMTQAQLVQSEKMASLGELTAGIAHEIQNPLNFVNNFSEVSSEMVDEMTVAIKNDDKENISLIASDLKENLAKITHHGKRAGGIVKSMLQHSRTSSNKKEPTDINAMVEEYLRLSYHGLRAKDKNFQAKFQTDLDPSAGKINAVIQDIGRVMLNLMNNAFYAVSQRQYENITGYEPMVSGITKRNGDFIFISIKDNGNGIPQHILNKIFQPFFTTKPTGQGTGLGLSLSYDIIKAHHGELKVETNEGVGSVFTIILPSES